MWKLYILGNFNEKVGKEEAYRVTTGKGSLHDVSNDNGQRLTDLTLGNLMVVRSTWLQRKNVRNVTWCSPDGITIDQIDHGIIDRRHASDILQIYSCRGADCDSDHGSSKIQTAYCNAQIHGQGEST
jgi:hypothetical protein